MFLKLLFRWMLRNFLAWMESLIKCCRAVLMPWLSHSILWSLNHYAILHYLPIKKSKKCACSKTGNLNSIKNYCPISLLLNQARAWFLKIHPVRIVCMCMCVCVCLRVCVCVCVCPPPRLLITSGMMWRDIDPIRLVKQLL